MPMPTDYSVDELLEFLSHAAQRGLMPSATSQALAVSSRRVLDILRPDERNDLRRLDIDAVVKRFGNKHAKDFNPSSLKEYGRRVHRAIELFLRWRADAAAFSVKTRSTATVRKKEKGATPTAADPAVASDLTTLTTGSGYQSAFPVRPGMVVTILNIPTDLSKAEADRLAQFINMLVVD